MNFVKRKGNSTVWILIVVVLLGALGYFVFTSTNPDEMTADVEYADEEISVSPDIGITADDILENPDEYEGQTVNLKSEVERWINPRAFLLDAPGFVNDNLLVITREPTYVFEDPELFGDSIWNVEGEVEQFTFTRVIDTYDLDLEPDAFVVYEGRPFVVADSVTLFED